MEPTPPPPAHPPADGGAAPERAPELDHIRHIRQVLDRHTRFLSLSGLSGVAAGAVALLGLAATAAYLGAQGALPEGLMGPLLLSRTQHPVLLVLGATALATFGGALGAAAYFTRRLALRHGHTPVWNASAQRLAASLFTPVAAGLGLCGALVLHGQPALVAPASLLCYGLGLVGASSHTLREVRALGLAQVALGLLGLYRPELGLLLWGLGFGVLHIGYGLWLYGRYERPQR